MAGSREDYQAKTQAQPDKDTLFGDPHHASALTPAAMRIMSSTSSTISTASAEIPRAMCLIVILAVVLAVILFTSGISRLLLS